MKVTGEKMGAIESKKRNVTADFLKGLMIFCVMYGHSISMINSLRGVTWQESIVNVFITTFEMPLFILISGYYLWFSLRKKSHFMVFKQRVISVAIPLLIWEGIPQIYHFIVRTINEGFSALNVLKIGLGIVYPRLWFLACYITCIIFVVFIEWVLSKVKSKNTETILASIIYSILIFCLHCIDVSLNQVPFMFPFFLIGFLLSKYDLLNNKAVRKIILVLAVLFIALYPFYEPENSFYILGSYILSSPLKLLPIFAHRFILSLCGCSLLYVVASFLCKRGENNPVVSLVAKLGGVTMELYILSTFVQELLVKLVDVMIEDNSIITDVTAPLILGPMFLVVMTAICLLANWLVQRIPKLHKYIFGR